MLIWKKNLPIFKKLCTVYKTLLLLIFLFSEWDLLYPWIIELAYAYIQHSKKFTEQFECRDLEYYLLMPLNVYVACLTSFGIGPV